MQKNVGRIIPRMECGYEDDNTKCPDYYKPGYKKAEYCIYSSWEGSCLNYSRIYSCKEAEDRQGNPMQAAM